MKEKEQFPYLCQSALMGSPHGFIIFDRNGKLVNINPAFKNIFGTAPDGPDDLISSTFLKHLGFYDQLKALQLHEVLQFSNIWLQVEHIFPTSSPKNICINCSAFGVFSPQKELEYYIIEIIDRTDQMIADSLLFESEKRYQRILESVSEILFSIHLEDSTISSLNKSGLELFGWTADEIIGTSVDVLISSKYQEYIRNMLLNVKEDRIPQDSIEIGFVTHKKEKFQADIHLQVVYLNSQPSELIIFVKNILMTNSATPAERDKQLESIGTLAGGIAHDFNNILAALLGNVTYALEQHDLGIVKSILTETEQTIHRGQNLSYQLLTFAKGGNPVTKKTDLTPLISNTAIHTLRSSTSRCTLDFDEILWEVEVDANQISQAFGNILKNADEAMKQGGNIYLSFHNRQYLTMHKVEQSALTNFAVPPGKYIEISIRDEGTGILKEIEGKIFEPYFSTKEVGAGLGLATAYSIIRNHGGYLTFTTCLTGTNQGTTFYAFLPVKSSPTETSIPVIQSDGEEKSKVTIKEKILVLEDEPAIVKILDKMLRHLDMDPTFTINGSDTIKEYKNALDNNLGFNLVLIDLTIVGGLGGKDTIIALQKLDPDVKAIVSSGYSNNPIMAHPTEYGFQDVLKKPFTLRELREIIAKYL